MKKQAFEKEDSRLITYYWFNKDSNSIMKVTAESLKETKKEPSGSAS